MFEEFWESKKGIIQFTAILIAIGAIFLNIQLPENESARRAMLSIQLIWLIIISILILILFINFSILAIKFEEKLKQNKFETEAFSYLSLFVLLYIIGNLYTYLFALYKNLIISILSNFLPFLILLLIAISYYIAGKIKDRFSNYFKNENVSIFFWGLTNFFIPVLLLSLLIQSSASLIASSSLHNFSLIKLVQNFILTAAFWSIAMLAFSLINLRNSANRERLKSKISTKIVVVSISIAVILFFVSFLVI